MTCYGLEYFCFEGDGLWNSSDDELIGSPSASWHRSGWPPEDDVMDGCVVRQTKAYPVYDDDYAGTWTRSAQRLRAHYPTLHLVGRNGMHKYNNQDHAMMTAMLTVREHRGRARQLYDLWEVNQDAEYHEAGNGSAQLALSSVRQVPRRVRPAA